MKKVPSPQAFFGFQPGSDRHMIRWNDLFSYYRAVEAASDRIRVTVMGPSTEGNPFIYLTISSAENLKKLSRYTDISRRLSDPRGLDETAVKALVGEGKAICMQCYSLHSNEVGGAQMCPLLVYDLVSGDTPEIREILDNVIFVMVPCAEPDGEIIFTDWYNRYLGTEFEGCCSPYLRHNYAGHSNNRDAIHTTVAESRYLVELMLKRFFPQAYQDHHHMYPHQDRMSIAPSCNPIIPEESPIVIRESALYGSVMAQYMEDRGFKGIVSGDEKYDAYPVSTFYSMANMFNIAGMLTESADARIATPIYIAPEQMFDMAHVDPSLQCPDNWPGGWWHLSDIVNQMYAASFALLSYMAHNREAVLSRMADKALRQTARGEAGRTQAYILPSDSFDASSVRRAVGIMLSHGVEVRTVTEPFFLGSRRIAEGSYLIPTAQPAYAFITRFFENCHIQRNRYALQPRPSDSLGDGANSCFGLNMGLEIVKAEAALASMLPHTEATVSVPEEKKVCPLPGCENASFAAANRLLRSGKALYRDKSGTFYDEPADGRTEVKPMKIGLLKMSFAHNSEEGYTRGLLKYNGYDFRIVLDRELQEKVPDDIDLLILPGDPVPKLMSGDIGLPGEPPEYRSGLGTRGAENLAAFVKNGGRLIAWEQSVLYLKEIMDLPIDVLRACPNWHGSTAALKLDPDDPLCAGMPADVSVLFGSAPVIALKPFFWKVTGSWSVPVRLETAERLAVNGPLDEPGVYGDTPAVIRMPYGRGEMVLYTFDPKFRLQTDATYKLLMNALYR